ncbi:MAG: hypothetical protein CMO30_17420 [Tistrella sp.]|uniref:Major capsid protein E n=1 Tax=Tistrella mobilis TaxID=171437 RepID=A0A3B9IPF1_9PROT|nr:hypothetical protein [Tistrella sp.]MAD36223.1 hypothetical protein [Tistrella sp.]MBA77051.1 hypothetical protein [Tistrella sp.]HAE49762.1 hypothetical protein [Tistrella mobilis]
MSMTSAQARVVDPVLSTHARGYRHPDRVGNLLFPAVPVDVAAGKVVEFGRESFMLYNARRSPGGATKRIQCGYVGKPYELVQDSLEGTVPRELARDASAVPGIDLGIRTTNTVMQALTLALEHQQAGIALDPANYDGGHKATVASGLKWGTDDGKPIADVEAARQAVRASCGSYPNVMVLGPVAYAALKTSRQIVDRFRNADIVTPQMLANLFELGSVVEGRAVIVENEEDGFVDVWGNAAVLAYVPPAPTGAEEPSFGYTYTMRDNPFVEQPYWHGNTKSWVYGVTYERQPVLTGMSAGFLIQAPAAEE